MHDLAGAIGKARGINALQMNRPWRWNTRWTDRLYDDWVDRMEGGDGCWVISEEEEVDLEVYADDPAPVHRTEFVNHSDVKDAYLRDVQRRLRLSRRETLESVGFSVD